MTDLFEAKVAVYGPRLVADLALRDFQAAGVFGNIGHECGGFRLMQEIHPVAGRGGYGWQQWTGPRRVAFESYCRGKGLSVDSDEANYGFLLVELRGSEAASLAGLRKTTTLETAAEVFCRLNERPGVVSMKDRVVYARRALAVIGGAKPAPLPIAVPPPASVPVAAAPSFWSRLFSRKAA